MVRMSVSFARGGRFLSAVWRAAGDVHLVVMQRVQGRGGRRGHPGGVAQPGHRMGDFLSDHLGHHIGRRPHALADLRATRQTAGKANVDIRVLIGLDPGRAPFISSLRMTAPASIEVWDLVAGTIEKTCIDEEDAIGRRCECRP